MKVINTINNASQLLAARLYTRGMSRADRQRGASALEYIVLAAVLIAIIAYIATNGGLGTKLSNAFSSLFTSAASKTSATVN